MVFSHQAMSQPARKPTVRIKKNFSTQKYKRSNGNEITMFLQVRKPPPEPVLCPRSIWITLILKQKNPTKIAGFFEICSSET